MTEKRVCCICRKQVAVGQLEDGTVRCRNRERCFRNYANDKAGRRRAAQRYEDRKARHVS